MIWINVIHEDFSYSYYDSWLSNDDQIGATVTFVGKVRNVADKSLIGLYLEHYPKMTEDTLFNIASTAKTKFNLNKVVIHHRVGTLFIGENIVFVGTSGAHRTNVYLANNFIMDYLKTQVPIWKKEIFSKEEKWVKSKLKDQKLLKKWLK